MCINVSIRRTQHLFFLCLHQMFRLLMLMLISSCEPGLTVDKLLYFRYAVMTFKCMNNLAPKYLCDMFEKRSCIHNRSTRNCNSIQIPLFKTTSGQRSFAFRGASIWNNLDTKLKKCTSLKTFKSQLKDHLLST